MLATWMEILPLFMVRWIAKKFCERLSQRGMIVVKARPDALFIIGFEKRPPKDAP